ncbi:penicillin-binding protein activator [Alcanivorax sp. 24]|uniref:penicillin-binding protein activator n=1 Tax=Alcanivorax sp. 24 TaxID=2545266 RepID=UPI00105C0FD8|nr:penicillin-binding protein activator [Alcanivorax sp. 24]
MELRPIRWAALLVILTITGCAQTPGAYQRSGTPAMDTAPAREAPSSTETARQRLGDLADPARTDTALSWASYYLVNDRAQEASDVLDLVRGGAQSMDQRFRWLQLSAQALLGQRQPQQALDLLDSYQGDIRSMPADQQARLALLHADALALNDNLMESLKERVEIQPRLGRSDRAYNQDMTWQALLRVPRNQLQQEAEGASGDLLGWLELADIYRDAQAGLDDQVARMNDWQQRWPRHPAQARLPETLNAMRSAAQERPARVAVLLPESGPLSYAGNALHDGLMAGYYLARDNGDYTPELRFYDTADANAAQVYQQAVMDGAQFVIGPLAKDQVAAIDALGTPPVPTLALNYLDDGGSGLYQFGLAPEDEARQVARDGYAAGAVRAGVLYPNSEWGYRVAEAFTDAWQSQGGSIVVSRTYADDDIGGSVKAFLGEARGNLGSSGGKEFRPRGPEDMAFVFLVANADQGRQVKPALNYHYARYLPVHSTSYIYGGIPDPRRDQDLDRVQFVDMPWVLNPDQRLEEMATANWPDGHGRYTRLFAMGVDAFRLQARLPMLNSAPGSTLSGATGVLHLDGQRVVRELQWATFKGGLPSPLLTP